MLVAIDGPAGAGKSTVARAVARELGFTYLDTGAMYRCVALLSLAAPAQEPGVLAAAARIELGAGPAVSSERPAAGAGEEREAVEGKRIRSPEVSETASLVAADPGVRDALVAKQRGLIAAGDWVAEGRDIGTVVAPGAELKVFLTASPQERAHRRALELGADPGAVLAEQTLRDERDSTRSHSPLRAAADAVPIDTTDLTLEQVVARIAVLARSSK
jgi:cytidylate kinase